MMQEGSGSYEDDEDFYVGSYHSSIVLFGDDDEEDVQEDDYISSNKSFASQLSEGNIFQRRQVGVANGDRESQQECIPHFTMETLQMKLSKMYGCDFGKLPFELAETENDYSSYVLPEKRKLVEKNYQLLLVIKSFEESLVSIYGPVGKRVLTEEFKAIILHEGLTAELIERAHSHAVLIYKSEKAKRVRIMDEIGDALRKESTRARQLSVDARTRKENQHDEYLSYVSKTDTLQDISLLDDDSAVNLKKSAMEKSMTDPKYGFVEDHGESVSESNRAIAKNWIVMKASEFELESMSKECETAKDDFDVIDGRETFVRLSNLDSQSSIPAVNSDTMAADLLLETLREQLKGLINAEKFYRDLRKVAKQEFKDKDLVKVIVENLNILINEIVKQRKEVEKHIKQQKGIKFKAKVMERPIPKFLMKAVRGNSEGGSQMTQKGESDNGPT